MATSAEPIAKENIPYAEAWDELPTEDCARIIRRMVMTSGYNQSQVSRKSNISRDLISYYISGKRKPRFQNFYKIVRALNVDLDDVLSATSQAADNDGHAIEMIQIDGDDRHVFLRINKRVEAAIAARVISILTE